MRWFIYLSNIVNMYWNLTRNIEIFVNRSVRIRTKLWLHCRLIVPSLKQMGWEHTSSVYGRDRLKDCSIATAYVLVWHLEPEEFCRNVVKYRDWKLTIFKFWLNFWGNWASINAKTVLNVFYDENTWNKVFESKNVF